MKRTVQFARSSVGGFAVEQTSAEPLISHPYHVDFASITEAKAFKTWLDTVKGRLTAFWVPSYQMDLTPVAPLVAGFTEMTIVYMGYTARLFPSQSRRQIGFVRFNGTVDQREVTAAVDNGDGTETLTLDSAVGAAWPSQIGLVSFVRLMRLTNDETVLNWGSSSDINVEMTLTELPREYGLDYSSPCLTIDGFDYSSLGAMFTQWTKLVPYQDGVDWYKGDSFARLTLRGYVENKVYGVTGYDNYQIYRDFQNLVVGDTYRIRAVATRSGDVVNMNDGMIVEGDTRSTPQFTTTDVDETLEAFTAPTLAGIIRVYLGTWYSPTVNAFTLERNYYYRSVELAGPDCQ